MSKRVLIVEDDLQLGRQLVEHLTKAGYVATWAKEGRLLDREDVQNLDLIVLDLMLPGAHGFDILKRLRTFSETPVLVLSARNETSDKIRALRLGADDYITKPFWPEELIERARARLRRPALERGGAVEVGRIRIDRDRRLVQVDGAPVELTRVEFDLLAVLAERPGGSVTRRTLAERVLDPERDGDERTLDVHVSRIRKKLGSASLVKTVWGIGYRLATGGNE